MPLLPLWNRRGRRRGRGGGGGRTTTKTRTITTTKREEQHEETIFSTHNSSLSPLRLNLMSDCTISSVETVSQLCIICLPPYFLLFRRCLSWTAALTSWLWRSWSTRPNTASKPRPWSPSRPRVALVARWNASPRSDHTGMNAHTLHLLQLRIPM